MQSDMVYKISNKGVEDLKGEVWSIDNIEKIGVIMDGGQPKIVIEYKKHIVSNHKVGFEMKTLIIK